MVDSLSYLWTHHLRIRLTLTVFLIVGGLGGLLALVWLIACIIFAPHGDRPKQIALGFDQLANATTGGDVDETISSRAGRMRKKDEKWACVLCWILDRLDASHCEKASRRR